MVKFLDLQAITQLHAQAYKEAAARVIDSGWFLQGNETLRFEKTLCTIYRYDGMCRHG